MLILCFGDILSTLADRESVLGVAESQQHLHLRELDRIRHTAEHPNSGAIRLRGMYISADLLSPRDR